MTRTGEPSKACDGKGRPTDDRAVQHEPENHRFFTAGGAVLTYRLVDGLHVLDHTEVPPALRGKGMAALLAQTALEHARANGWQIVPACSYIASHVQRHPEFAVLVARPARPEKGESQTDSAHGG